VEQLWIQNISITTGLVNTNTTTTLLQTVQSGRIDPRKLIMHRFKLGEIEKAYEVFGNAAKEKALKVILSA
jgi:alcohol dehydrogenase